MAAHLAEVHGAVFPADVLLALAVGRLGLRRDRLACRGRARQPPQVTFSCIILLKWSKCPRLSYLRVVTKTYDTKQQQKPLL